jgi:hypothetical protein
VKNKLPNFLIVGAQKSGTTSLYNYLKQHYEVFMPERLKEPKFFVSPIFKKINHNQPLWVNFMSNTMFEWQDYLELFEKVQKEKAIGESSVTYLYYYKTAIILIRKYLGNIKIIISLRNPVDRAFSAYLHLRRDNRENISFKKTLKEEDRRKKNYPPLYHYTSIGFYYHQVKAYLDNFDQVKIYLFDDLKKDTLSLVKDMYGFLGVDTSFTPDVSIRYNVSGIPKNKFIHKFLREQNILKSIVKSVVKTLVPYKERRKIIEKIKMKNLQKPQMKPETREYLKNLYRKDILKLQDLIKRDLSHWLK